MFSGWRKEVGVQTLSLKVEGVEWVISKSPSWRITVTLKESKGKKKVRECTVSVCSLLFLTGW